MHKKITRFGYIINKKVLDEEKLSSLKKELTVTPFKMQSFAKFSKDDSFPVYMENGDYIGIPKYFGLERFGEPDINKLEKYEFPLQEMNYIGVLRPKQEIIVNKVIDGFREKRGGLLIAGCGSGKTNMAIWIACHLKLKTLFVVHKNFLKNQVINRIRSTTDVEEIGEIQGKKVKVDCPFVIGMIQTLSKKNPSFSDEIFKDFGLIIIDEVHHMGAKNFSRFYQRASAKYMLGISAERSRNDGMYKIINWYMGPILHQEEQQPNDMVVVKRFHFKTSNEARIETIINRFTKEPDRSTMITNLVFIKKRNRFILNLILELYDQGKNILFLTGRLSQVNILFKLLKKNPYTRNAVGKYLGGMNEGELAESATKQIILGTYEMAQEGLDIENLNVVILGTPKSSIKQSVGRILRKEIYEEHPIVIDIIDDNEIYRKQGKIRAEYYRKQKYNFQDFHITDTELPKKSSVKYYMYDDNEYLSEALTKIPEKTQKKEEKKISVDEFEDIDFLSD